MEFSAAEGVEDKHPGGLETICEGRGEQLLDRDRTCALEQGEDGYVWISDVQAVNACNHALVGTFWLGLSNTWFRRKARVIRLTLH